MKRSTQTPSVPHAGLILGAAIMLFMPARAPLAGNETGADSLVLEAGAPIPIYVSEAEAEPLRKAVADLQRDLEKILGAEFPLTHDKEDLRNGSAIVVAGPEVDVRIGQDRWVDGWEAHRVFVEQVGDNPYLVLQGPDTRGALYAVYTFSEQLLGVPPLWVWTSWEPETQDALDIPLSTDLKVDPPYVKWRTWFPNDQDYLIPWMQRDPANRDAVAETMLRLKLNAWDTGGVVAPSFDDVTSEAHTARERGIAVMSTHTSPLGTRMEDTRWNNYWSGIRNQAPPPRTLSNLPAMLDFWRHSMGIVLDAQLETIWTVTFRAHGDVAFWEDYEDAPQTDAERAAFIRSMLDRQIELVDEHGGPDPIMRIPLYHEMSDYFVDGLLELPRRPDVIWNIVAARRDHYPPHGLTERPVPADQPLGLYFNLQFTSTGSHVAQGEGPWKMEANYRVVDGLNERPLELSMVNTGNVREFVMGLTANARMMWDFETYDSDSFLVEFCERYFGESHAEKVARLYRDFFHSYWEQKASTLEGFDRQFIFHDFRYARAMREILPHLERGERTLEPIRRHDFFMIEPEHSGAETTLEAIIAGTSASIEKLEDVTARADTLLRELPEEARPFFNDNLRVQSHFMLEINRSLRALARALDHVDDGEQNTKYLAEALETFREGRKILKEAEHGRFERWYPRPGDRDLFRFDEIESRMAELNE